MVCHTPGCMGNYDFDQIAFFARKRFVEGYSTITLLQSAKSEREKEEISLVAMLDISDDEIKDIQLSCRHAKTCTVTICRKKLREMIEEDLKTLTCANKK